MEDQTEKGEDQRFQKARIPVSGSKKGTENRLLEKGRKNCFGRLGILRNPMRGQELPEA